MRRVGSLASLRDGYDLVIVGAGPAGMAAAAEASRRGLITLLVDEALGLGGQIWRGLDLRSPSPWVRDGSALRAEVEAAAVDFAPSTSVWHLAPDLHLGLTHAESARLIAARRVILATGSNERPMPVPGWTLPGVMTVGAAQTLLKAQGLLPDGRTILVGSGPLVWQFAAQCLAGGRAPTLFLDTTPRANRRLALRHLAGFATSRYARASLALVATVRKAGPPRCSDRGYRDRARGRRPYRRLEQRRRARRPRAPASGCGAQSAARLGSGLRCCVEPRTGSFRAAHRRLGQNHRARHRDRR